MGDADDLFYQIRIKEVGTNGRNQWLVNPRADNTDLRFDTTLTRADAECFTLNTARALVSIFNRSPDQRFAAVIVRSDLPS